MINAAEQLNALYEANNQLRADRDFAHRRYEEIKAERDQAKAEAAVLWRYLNDALDKAHNYADSFSDNSLEFQLGGKHIARRMYNLLFKLTENPVPSATAFLAEHERLKQLVETGVNDELVDQQQAMQEEIERLKANQRTPGAMELCRRCGATYLNGWVCHLKTNDEKCPIRAAKENA